MANSINILINAQNNANRAFDSIQRSMMATRATAAQASADLARERDRQVRSWQQINSQITTATNRHRSYNQSLAVANDRVRRIRDDIAALSGLTIRTSVQDRQLDELRNRLVLASGAAQLAQDRFDATTHELHQLSHAANMADHNISQLNHALMQTAALQQLNMFQRMFDGIGNGIAGMVNELDRSLRRLGPGLAGFAAILAAIATFAVPLLGIIGNLSGVLGLIPGVLLSIGAAAGVMVLALDFDKPTRNAKSFLDEIKKWGKELDKLKAPVQNSFFAGWAKGLEAVRKNLMPLVKEWAPALAKSFGEAGRKFLDFFAKPETAEQINNILADVKGFLDGILGSVTPLTQAFLDIAEAAGFGEVGEDIQSAAQNFADWIREIKDDGTLQQWIEDGKEAFGQFMDLLDETGDLLGAIMDGGKESGENFLVTLTDIVRKWEEWAESEDGQQQLKLLGDLAVALLYLLEIMRFMMPAWGAVFDTAKKALLGLELAMAVTALKIVNGMKAALGWIPGFKDSLAAAERAVADWVADVNNEIANLDKNVIINVGANIQPSLRTAISLVRQVARSGGNATFRPRASGGVSGGWHTMNESGPELVRLPQGSMVYPAGQSRQMMSQARSGGGVTVLRLEAGDGGMRGFYDMLAHGLNRGYIRLTANGAPVKVG